MKILVTGTAGFIGFHVARYLLEQGNIVVGIDNFNNYYSVKLKKDRDSLLHNYEQFQTLTIDICDYEKMKKVFSQEKFDVVCNLAAQAGVRYSLENPHSYINANIVGFLNILECCRHYQVKRLVYASSSSVYGGNQNLPFSEKDRVDNPISLYAASKKSNELIAHSYTHLFDIQTIGLRFFTVYGPWGRPDMALWLFTEAIINNQSINVFNNGDMQRDFTYIDDIVEGVIAAIHNPALDKYEMFNLGNNRSEDLIYLIETLEELLDRKAKKKLLPMQPGDVKATFADIESAKKKLGFEPKTKLVHGMKEFVTWYKNYFKV